MRVHIEPLAACIRVWHDDAAQWGDPYDWSATGRWIDAKTFEVIGVDKTVTRDMVYAIGGAAWMQGASRVGFTRYRRGEWHRFWGVTDDGQNWSFMTERKMEELRNAHPHK